MSADDLLGLVAEREGILDALTDGPLTPRDVVDRVEASRSTFNRAVRELDDAGLVDRSGGECALTPTGRLVLDRYRECRRDIEGVLATERALAPLDPDAPVDPAVLVDADVHLADGSTPYRPEERLHDCLRRADRYCAVLPALDDPRHVRLLYEHVVTDDCPAELLVSRRLADSLADRFPRRLAAMADTEGFDLLTGEVPPFGVVLAEDDGSVTVALVVFGDHGVHAVVFVDTDRARDWAEEVFEEYRDRSSVVMGEFRQSTDGGAVLGGATGGVGGPGLLVALEREGFVRLSTEFFTDRRVADPATAWRAGLDLAEVHTGYAVERPLEESDAESETLTDRLVERLRAGEDCVLVGPPGSGKSTTCKRVASEWYAADRGPVLYRESGRGAAFESVDELVANVRAGEGHALVVVEDAVRPDADAVFEAIECLADSEDVSVLLDAREREWRDPPAGADVDPTGVDLCVVPMPRLADRDYERLVEHFQETAGVDVDVPIDRLRERVRSSAADEAGVGGEILPLLHRLATYADPLATGTTSLEADATAVYDAVVDCDGAATDVAVAANLLNAAGVAFGPGVLRAVARADGPDGVVPEPLEDRVLFGLADDGTYRTVHEAWSVAFLGVVLDREGGGARDRVGRVAGRVLSLADDPDLRERVRRTGPDGSLERAAADPAAWADRTVEALYGLGRERPKLAPLFGDERGPAVAPPDACESVDREDCTVWLGRMLVDGGAYDEARAVARAGFEVVPEDSEAYCRLLGVRAGAQFGQSDYERARETTVEQSALADRLGLDGLGVEALHRLGTVAQERGAYERAEEHLRECLSLARETGDRRMEATVRNELGVVAYEQGEYDTARRHLEAGLDIARAVGDRRAEASSLGSLGSVLRMQSDHEEAETYHRRSLEIKREVGDRRGVAATLGNLGVLFKRRGQYDRAEEHFERSLEIKRDIGDREGASTTLQNLGNVAFLRGEYDRAVEYERESLAIKREIGDRRGEGASRCNLGVLAWAQGAYDRAEEHFERSLAITRDIGDREGVQTALGELGNIALRRGEFDRAHELLSESLEMSREMGLRRGETTSLINLGLVAKVRGEDAAAREFFTAALEVARAVEIPRLEGSSLLGLGSLARREGQYDRARERLDRALALFEEVDADQCVPRARLELGRLALATGDLGRAAEHARAAREAFETMDDRHRIVRSRRLLGRVAAERGDHETAREQFEAAVDVAGEVGEPHEQLATLEHLVEHCRERGDHRAAAEWHERARTTLADAPEATADRHRERIERTAVELDDD